MKTDLLPSLRKELENIFGRKILSSRDCLQMVEDIYQKTGYSINANTLRRFFGLVKTDYSASPSTVTILSKYCGFNSLDEIENIAAIPKLDENIHQEEVLHFLISIYKNLGTGDSHQEIVESLVQQTIIFLERNPSLIDHFQREVAKIGAGHYYFESCVNMDRLNGYFGDGLNYYLRAKNTDEAKLFVHALLVFRYWLTRDRTAMDKHMAIMTSISLSQSYPAHVLGRVMAARIFHAHVTNQPLEKIFVEASRFQAVLHGKGSIQPHLPYFELAMAEALVLTEHYEDAEEYIKKGKALTQKKDPALKNHFNLWDNITLDMEKKIDLTIKPRSVVTHTFLNRRYLTLVGLVHKVGGRKEQLHLLVKETGFTRFGSQ